PSDVTPYSPAPSNDEAQQTAAARWMVFREKPYCGRLPPRLGWRFFGPAAPVLSAVAVFLMPAKTFTIFSFRHHEHYTPCVILPPCFMVVSNDAFFNRRRTSCYGSVCFLLRARTPCGVSVGGFS